MTRLVVRPAAKADIRDAAAFYEGERPGLGEAFLDEVATIFSRARKLPRQFPEIGKGVRRALLRRFPYAVYFSMPEEPRNEGMVVLAVLHQHRAPRRRGSDGSRPTRARRKAEPPLRSRLGRPCYAFHHCSARVASSRVSISM